MIYLPNKYERYTAALRSHLQQRVIKRGISPKLKSNLKKIYIFEALNSSEALPINLKGFTITLFNIALIRYLSINKHLKFEVNISGNYLINFKAYEALLLSLIDASEFIEIKSLKEQIIIIARLTETNFSLKLIKKLEGSYFYDIKRKKILISLKTVKTNKKAIAQGYSSEELLNPLSKINVFF